MTHETYENLMRVQLKRQSQGALQGDWNGVADASRQIVRLNAEMAESISPNAVGHQPPPPLPRLVRPFIVCAAMLQKGRIITGARHYDAIMRSQMKASEGLAWWRGCEQGFIDQRGNFLTRGEAHKLAAANGQILRRCAGDHETLCSENLY